MKRYLKFFITIFTLCTFTLSIFGAGDGNVDSGGSGGTGSGTSQNKWSYGDDAVRISIVDIESQQIVRTSIDFTNKDRSNIKYHFGKVSKLQYKNGNALALYQGGYSYIIPEEKMPTIVSNKGNNISEIKKYFTSEWTVKRIAEKSNIDYDELISGKYKLLLEPMIYVTYKGNRLAMTSHEAALYNEKMKNDIVMKFNSISHRSLPFSMFLEVSDLGFPAYTGQTSTAVKDHVIKEQLGLGIVRFNGILPENPTNPTPPPKPPVEKPNIDVATKEYEYRTNTDVISSLEIKSSSRVTPDNPITVTFNILGKNYTVSDIVMPENSSQLVWVKWRTPSTPQTVIINASISNASISSATIKANVVELVENTPPDPLPRDVNENFKLVNLPQKENKISATWSRWSAKWKEDWQWVVYGEDEDGNEIGEMKDLGDWEYSITNYSANLSASMDLVPGLRTPPTWKEKNGEYEMKSGYGVNTKINTNVSYNCSTNDVTSAQNVITTFSDFEYKKYNRILDKTSNSGFKTQFEFKTNKYSTYKDRTHYTPVWYKDGVNYIVDTEIIDVWTPIGMLRANINDKILIQGNLHQDRHIGIMK